MAERIHDAIVGEVSGWPGVTTGRHRFGGVEFRLERRELGHLHGSRLADLPFPLLVRTNWWLRVAPNRITSIRNLAGSRTSFRTKRTSPVWSPCFA